MPAVQDPRIEKDLDSGRRGGSVPAVNQESYTFTDKEMADLWVEVNGMKAAYEEMCKNREGWAKVAKKALLRRIECVSKTLMDKMTENTEISASADHVQRCENCRFWSDTRMHRDPGAGITKRCVRFPPIANTTPMTPAEFWCGEWSRKP